MFDAFVYTLTLVDVVGGLPVTISRYLSLLVYLCNKFIIVVATAFVYCCYIRLFRENIKISMNAYKYHVYECIL